MEGFPVVVELEPHRVHWLHEVLHLSPLALELWIVQVMLIRITKGTEAQGGKLAAAPQVFVKLHNP